MERCDAKFDERSYSIAPSNAVIPQVGICAG
ncbi:unannotated protein [freshwater metagenome]|uniref:Unannotated protein n=1 Tax=freshwater metagenome TaxID=449393 RepID=A0A6J6WX27_9ZZZZ